MQRNMYRLYMFEGIVDMWAHLILRSNDITYTTPHDGWVGILGAYNYVVIVHSNTYPTMRYIVVRVSICVYNSYLIYNIQFCRL